MQEDSFFAIFFGLFCVFLKTPTRLVEKLYNFIIEHLRK